jgi:signal recognition particle subunit SEC65
MQNYLKFYYNVILKTQKRLYNNGMMSKKPQVSIGKEEITLEYITAKVIAAKNEHRDFSFTCAEKAALQAKYGIEKVCETLIKAIRDTNTPIIDRLTINTDKEKLLGLIQRVLKESDKEHPTNASWGYKLGKEQVQHNSLLLTVSSSGSMLSTALNGYYRYTQRVVKKAKTPEENWNNNKMLKKAITYNCTNKVKAVKEALSRNRVRVFCMQGNGCHYGTAFPISVVAWIIKREAGRRPLCEQRPLRIVDPCAGWGDRLAGSLIVGKDVVEHYYGIDPWEISNESCRNIHQVLSSIPSLNVGTAEFAKKGAQDDSDAPHAWPESDLVLICPPYGELECYNVDGEDTNDQQAWRLCKSNIKENNGNEGENGENGNEGDNGENGEIENRFISHFIIPMFRNAAKSIASRNGRIIINVANTKKKDGGEFLTRDVLEAAEKVGLKCVETFGMRLSVRAPKTTFDHAASVLRGEPFFVFELDHSTQSTHADHETAAHEAHKANVKII